MSHEYSISCSVPLKHSQQTLLAMPCAMSSWLSLILLLYASSFAACFAALTRDCLQAQKQVGSACGSEISVLAHFHTRWLLLRNSKAFYLQ